MTECPCTKSEIDIFRPVNVQVAMVEGFWQTYYPIHSLTNSNVIEFLVPGTTNQMIDFPECSLYVRGKFTKANADAVEATNTTLTCANNLLHAMIRHVDVSINGQLLTRASKDYAYKNMFLKLLQTDMPRGGILDPQLIMEGFCMDASGNPVLHTEAGNKKSLDFRRNLIKSSRTFELRGALSVDLFECDRNLLMGSDVNIKIHLNDPAFYMIDTNATVAEKITPKLVLEHVELYVRRITIADSFVNSINQTLSSKDALYPFTRRELITMTIPAGSTTFIKENLFRGQLAVRYFIAMVTTTSYNGNISESPFYFQPFDIKEISLMENGQPMAQGPLKMNFTNNAQVINAYRLLLESIGAVGDRALATPVTLKHFCDGCTIFCFTRSPDLTHGMAHLPAQTGNITLHMSFNAALADSIMVICMAEFDSRLQINEDKNVVTDYAV